MAKEFIKVEKYQNMGTVEAPDFELVSTWTSAESVEMSDGTTVEEKLNNLNTIEYAERAGSVEWANIQNAPVKGVEYDEVNGKLTFIL